MKLFVVVICMALLASVSAQGDIVHTLMMLRMLGGGGSGGGLAGLGGGLNGGLGGGLNLGQSGSSTRSPGANRLRASSRSSGLGSLLGGRMGMNPLLLMGGSDRMRDMMMCNMMQGTMRTLCMTRAFQ